MEKKNVPNLFSIRSCLGQCCEIQDSLGNRALWSLGVAFPRSLGQDINDFLFNVFRSWGRYRHEWDQKPDSLICPSHNPIFDLVGYNWAPFHKIPCKTHTIGFWWSVKSRHCLSQESHLLWRLFYPALTPPSLMANLRAASPFPTQLLNWKMTYGKVSPRVCFLYSPEKV